MHQERLPALVSVAPSGSPLLLYVGVCWIPLLAPQTLQTSPSSSLPNPPSQPFRIEQTITSLWKSQQDLRNAHRTTVTVEILEKDDGFSSWWCVIRP